MTALDDVKTAQAELHASSYWKPRSSGFATTHLYKCDVALQGAIRNLATPVPTPTPTPSGRWFADTAYMNQKLPANLTLDPLNAQYQAVMRTAPAIWGNGLANAAGAGSTPVYHSDAATPRITVALPVVPYKGASSVTFPCAPAWKTSPDSDGHLCVIEPDGTYWEFQALDLANKVAHSVSKGSIYGDGVPTVTDEIAPLPTPAGMIRPEEIAAGVIPHALRIAAAWTCPAAYGHARWPAGWSDGGNPQGPLCGTRVALLPTADLSSLTNASQKVVTTALQEYGAHFSDAAGLAIALYFQSTAGGALYPFQSFSLPKQIVDQLVVLAP